MKIVFTIGTLSGGGAERVIARLSSRFSELGHDVHVLLVANGNVTYPISKGVNVKYIKPLLDVKFIRGLSRMIEYRKEVKRIAPDVVISFTAAVNIFVMQSLRGLKIKTILSERNNPYVDPPSAKKRKSRDKLYERADGIVFQTADARDYFSDSIKAKSKIIPNPLDSNIPETYDGERDHRIVTVGRLEPQKNHKMLIDAFSELHKAYPDYTLEIYGEGGRRAELEEQINTLGLSQSVRLMGYSTNVLEAIRSAAMFVLPSDYEGISNALIEALALGIPTVSTDHPIGGARSVICDGENGLLTPVGDKDSLKSAMELIIKTPSLASRLTDEAIKIREELSIDKIAAEWLEFITFTLVSDT